MPIVFEENAGQTSAGVRFVTRQGDFMSWFAPGEIVFGLGERGREWVSNGSEAAPPARRASQRVTKRTAIRMRLIGANPSPGVVGLDPLPGVSHYLLGSDPAAWRTHVRHYRRLAYRDLYPGVDLVFYSSRTGRLEYDFEVQPGADEGAIELAFEGMDDAAIDGRGDLVLRVPGGELRHRRPVSLDADSRPLVTRFSRKSHGRFGLQVEGRDRRRRLRIDPQIEWIREGGADNDWGYDVAVDREGSAYLTGITWSADFPSVGGLPPGSAESDEAFVLKLGPDNQIQYSTYFGAAGAADLGLGIAVDAQGQAAVAGQTWGNLPEASAPHPGMCAADAGVTGFLGLLAADGASFRFSTCLPADTAEAVAFDHNDPLGSMSVVGGAAGDAFIGRYLPVGAFVYARTWGGSSTDTAYDVALGPAGRAFVVGRTDSANLPGTAQGLQPSLPLGGGFVAAFSPTGVLERATYLGGVGGRSAARGVAVDSSGDVFVTGWTLAPDFPLAHASRSALRDSPWGPVSTAFITRLRPNLGELVYSTFHAQEGVPVGGPAEYVSSEEGRELAVDSAGNAHVVGAAFTFDDDTYFEGVFAWLASFDPTGQPKESLLLDLTPNGDEANGIAVADSGELYVVGHVDYLWACEWVEGVGERCHDVSDSDVFVGRIPGPPSGEIVILPSTTRWKPQRATGPADPLSPVKIVLKGPNDLDLSTVRLEVTPPPEFIGTYTATKGTVTRATGTDDQYTFDWTGPWTYTDSTGVQVMPRGNYKLIVAGKRQNSDTELKNDPPYDKVSLVEVVAIAVEDASGLVLQNNPSRGGGKRIFAEAAQPAGTVMDKLKLTATILPTVSDAPAGQGVTVHFRSFDVDDPSAATAPVDDESQPTDNCLEAIQGAPQNCPVPDAGFMYEPSNDPNAGSPVDGAVGLQLEVSGDQAVAGLRVATLAGANYRVAASTSARWLGTLSAPGNRIDGAVLDETIALPEGQQVTPMVTVWRTLHLQTARMTLPSFPQSAMERQATATCATPPCIQGHLLEDTNLIPHPDHGTTTDTWMGADLDVTPATPQGSPRSDKHVVSNSTATTLVSITPLVPFDPNLDYALWDDEADSLSIWPEPDVSLARDILRDAYIEVDTLTGVAPSFKQNLTDAEVAALPTEAASAPEYWTAPVVLTFESDIGRDGDPSFPERFIFGLTNGASDARQPKVAVYSEAIRDYRETPLASPPAPANRVSRDEIMTNTTAHEILHLFGLIHDGNRTDGGIMCASLYVDGNEPNRTTVTAHQLRKLRQAFELRILRDSRDCP